MKLCFLSVIHMDMLWGDSGLCGGHLATNNGISIQTWNIVLFIQTPNSDCFILGIMRPHFFYVLISGTFVPTKTISLTWCCVEKKCRGSNPWQETWWYGSDNKKRRWQRRTWGGRLVFWWTEMLCNRNILGGFVSGAAKLSLHSWRKSEKCLAARFETSKLTTVHEVL
jgi:hypothetical protein